MRRAGRRGHPVSGVTPPASASAARAERGPWIEVVVWLEGWVGGRCGDRPRRAAASLRQSRILHRPAGALEWNTRGRVIAGSRRTLRGAGRGRSAGLRDAAPTRLRCADSRARSPALDPRRSSRFDKHLEELRSHGPAVSRAEGQVARGARQTARRARVEAVGGAPAGARPARATALDLDAQEHAPAHGDQVELAARGAHALAEDAPALGAQSAGDETLAQPPELAVVEREPASREGRSPAHEGFARQGSGRKGAD